LGWVAAAAVAGGITAVVVVLAARWQGSNQVGKNEAATARTAVGDAQPSGALEAVPVVGNTPQWTGKQLPRPNPQIDKAEADRLFRQGMKLSADMKYLEARSALSDAVFSDTLSPEDAERARDELQHLAEATIFSQHVFAGDPYTFMYDFKQGDRLADMRAGNRSVAGLVTARDLRVPAEAILKVNGVSAKDLRAGQKYKMIRGPFHAIIYKRLLVMDIYLQRDDNPRVFIRRVRVGLGKDGSTPVGAWIVEAKAGGKGTHAVWNPPSGSGLRGPIRYGDKNYAFGQKGMWIRIAGIDPMTRSATGYGMHSTSDPSSIGKEASLGCIRLGDDDIELVFNILYEGHSTVLVKP
jgi:hypothetical protein